jgi:flagellin-like hook-associated protein FlgL
MTRIGTYGANQTYLARLTAIQERLSNRQIQLTTELKSVSYTGISKDTNRLINFENDMSRAQEFIDSNTMATNRLKLMDTSLAAIESSMKNFRDRLDAFYAQTTRNKSDIESIQKLAFDSMIDLQSYLAASDGGDYLFSGGRVSNEPVNLPARSLEGFQAIYDGNDHTFPTTRNAHMAELATTSTSTGSISFDAATGTFTAASLTSTTNNPLSDLTAGTRITVDDTAGGANDNKVFTVRNVTTGVGGTTVTVSPLVSEGPVAATVKYYTSSTPDQQKLTGNLTFSPGADTITVSNSTGFAAGQTFEVSGTASNNGVYEVGSITAGPPDVITIKSTKVATQAASATIKLSATSWYNGDTLTIQHRVAADRTVDVGIHASDPAFEKAFRAMGLIAQGVFGTGGGLENNLDRVESARYLIRDALDSPAGTTPPYGEELTSDLKALRSGLGTTTALISSKNELHKQLISFVGTRVINMEKADRDETVTLLLDDQRALEASYQSLSKIRSMSLLNFLN